MGTEGAWYSSEVGEFAEEFIDTVAGLGDVTWKKMFGGAGVFVDGEMFALIDSSARLYLKAGEDDRDRFETAGGERHGRMPYYSVPDNVLDDDSLLVGWAESAADAARS